MQMRIISEGLVRLARWIISIEIYPPMTAHHGSGDWDSHLCYFFGTTVSTQSETVTAQPFSWTSDAASPAAEADTILSTYDIYAQARYECPEFVDSCSFLKLTVHIIVNHSPVIRLGSDTSLVKATTADGCPSADTLQVLNLYALPPVGLDHSPGLCAGETRTLSAARGYTYLCSTGSTEIMPTSTFYSYAWSTDSTDGDSSYSKAISQARDGMALIRVGL